MERHHKLTITAIQTKNKLKKHNNEKQNKQKKQLLQGEKYTVEWLNNTYLNPHKQTNSATLNANTTTDRKSHV